MNKIIKGKRYDTETAQEIYCASSNVGRGDFSFWEETLYKKRTGEYFLYGEGGAMSKYRTVIDQNNWSGGEKIVPLSLDEAKEWAEKYMTADEYEEEFGTVEESAGKTSRTFSLHDADYENLKKTALEKDVSMSDLIAELIGNMMLEKLKERLISMNADRSKLNMHRDFLFIDVADTQAIGYKNGVYSFHGGGHSRYFWTETFTDPDECAKFIMDNIYYKTSEQIDEEYRRIAGALTK